MSMGFATLGITRSGATEMPGVIAILSATPSVKRFVASRPLAGLYRKSLRNNNLTAFSIGVFRLNVVASKRPYCSVLILERALPRLLERFCNYVNCFF